MKSIQKIALAHLSQRPFQELAKNHKNLGYPYPEVLAKNLVVDKPTYRNKLFRIIYAFERPSWDYKKGIHFIDFQVSKMDREGYWRDLIGYNESEETWTPQFSGRFTAKGITVLDGRENATPELIQATKSELNFILDGGMITLRRASMKTAGAVELPKAMGFPAKWDTTAMNRAVEAMFMARGLVVRGK